MATPQFKAVLAIAIILFFGGIAMIIAGGTCTGIDPKCNIPYWGSVTILVSGIVAFILGILGTVAMFYAWVAGVTYRVSS